MKKYLPYLIPIAILGGIVFFAFRKSDKPDITTNGGDESNDSEKQKVVIPEVDSIMKLSPSEATKVIKNKKILTKTSTTNLRTQPFVNDGFINNLFDFVEGEGKLLGEAVEVVVDSGSMMNPNTKRPYKWVKFKLDKNLYDELQSKKSFLTRNTSFIQYYPWVREDVIKF